MNSKLLILGLLLIALLILGAVLVVQAQHPPVVLEGAPQVYTTQGSNGLWYAMCLNRCGALVVWTTIDDWQQGRESADAVINWYNDLYRANNP